MNNKKNIYIGGVFLLALIVIAIVFFSFSSQKSEERKFYKVTENINNESLQRDGLLFYTGSFFAKYNFSQNKIEKMSHYLHIENEISEFDWSDTKVLFRSTTTNRRDDLHAIMSRFNIDTSSSLWWIYDFKKNNYNLISTPKDMSCEYMKQLDTSTLVCFENKNGIKNIYTLNYKSGEVKKIGSFSDGFIKDIIIANKTIFYNITKDNRDTIFKIDTTKNRIYTVFRTEINETVNSFTSTDGNHLLVVSNEIEPGSEDHLEDSSEKISQRLSYVSSNQNKVIQEDTFITQQGRVFINTKNMVSYYSLDGSIKTVVNGKITNSFQPSKDPNYTAKLIFNDSQTVYTLTYNGSLTSTDKKRLQKTNTSIGFNPQEDNNKRNDATFWIEKDPLDTQTTVYLYSDKDFIEQTNEIDTYLRKKNFEPSEFLFTWDIPNNENGVTSTSTRNAMYIILKK